MIPGRLRYGPFELINWSIKILKKDPLAAIKDTCYQWDVVKAEHCKTQIINQRLQGNLREN